MACPGLYQYLLCCTPTLKVLPKQRGCQREVCIATFNNDTAQLRPAQPVLAFLGSARLVQRLSIQMRGAVCAAGIKTGLVRQWPISSTRPTWCSCPASSCDALKQLLLVALKQAQLRTLAGQLGFT